MNAENRVLLQSIPQSCNMKEGLEYDDTIGCAKVVSVSTSCSRYSFLMFSLYSMTHRPHVLIVVFLYKLSIYSVML